MIDRRMLVIDQVDRICAEFLNKQGKIYRPIGNIDYNDYSKLPDSIYSSATYRKIKEGQALSS